MQTNSGSLYREYLADFNSPVEPSRSPIKDLTIKHPQSKFSSAGVKIRDESATAPIGVPSGFKLEGPVL